MTKAVGLIPDAQDEAENKEARRILLMVYEQQEYDERETGESHHINAVGFSSYDAPFASDLAEKLLRGRDLSDKQWYHVRKLAKRYSKQAARLEREV